MTGSRHEDTAAATFEVQRGRLVAVATRMLGSRADAEDAVQEAWLRFSRQDPATIDNVAGWLTTVVGRVCIDVLRSRNARPQVSYDDLVVTEDNGPAPDDDALLAESVGLALQVVLDTLRPSERLAFVLHDLFAVPFEEIGQILGKSADATKMLASRARRKVRGGSPAGEEVHRKRAVVDAFMAAARDGDFAGLLRVLDPDVVWRDDSARGVVVRLGATEVAARAQRGAHSSVVSRRVSVNGEPGVVAWSSTGRPLSVMACTVADGRIVELVSLRDPRRLASLDLPAPPA